MTDSPQQGSGLANPEWQRAYELAIRETNPLHLGEKIHAAETAISTRLREIENTPSASTETQALKHALDALQQKQIAVFGYPDWQT